MAICRRNAGVVAGVLAIFATTPPCTSMAQQTRGSILVAVPFHSPAEPQLGIDVAEAFRQRMIRQFPQKSGGPLRVLTRLEINNFVLTSGFLADSTMSTADLKELGRATGSDESIEGTVTRTAGGVEVRAHFYSLNNIGAPEALPTVTEKNPENAGRAVADAYIRARKELPDYQKCRGGLMTNNLDQAAVAAKAALVQYDNGVLPRACLMGVYFKMYQAKSMPIDSTIRVAEDIMRIDADNQLALGQLADAYLVSGDTTKSIELNLRLYRLNPTNVAVARSTVDALRSVGAPEQALPIVRGLLATDPGDVSMLEVYWRTLQSTRAWKEAIAAGEQMVKVDSSKADTTYFNLQIASAKADSQQAVVIRYLREATAKFSTSTRYWLAYSQELRRDGQLQASLAAAQKALAIDPKVANGHVIVLSLYAAVGQADSAIGFAKTALAAGVDKAAVGNSLLPLIGSAVSKAQKSDARADWEEAYRQSATVDSLAPTTNNAFYLSVSAYTIGSKAVLGVADIAKIDKVKACAENKVAGDMLLVSELNMSRGASVDVETARKLMVALGQYRPYVEQYRKSIPCK